MKSLSTIVFLLSTSLLFSQTLLFEDLTQQKVFSQNNTYWQGELKKFNEKNKCAIAFKAIENADSLNTDSLVKHLYINLPAASKPKDQGAQVLISLKPITVSIHSGSGLEEYIPATFRKHLIQTEILPLLQSKKYEQVVETALLKIMDKALMKDRPKAGQRLKPSMFQGYYLIVFILLVLFAAVMAYLTTTGTWKEIQWNQQQKKNKQ